MQKCVGFLSHEDKLTMSKTNREFHSLMYGDLEQYRQTRKLIGECLSSMIDLLNNTARERVMWKFSFCWQKPITNDSLCLVLHKINTSSSERKSHINGECKHHSFKKKNVLEWFEMNMLHVYSDIIFSGQCNYNLNTNEYNLFKKLTNTMHNLLPNAKKNTKKTTKV